MQVVRSLNQPTNLFGRQHRQNHHLWRTTDLADSSPPLATVPPMPHATSLHRDLATSHDSSRLSRILISICWIGPFLLGMILAANSIGAEVSEIRMTPIVLAVQRARPSVVNIQGQKMVADESGVAGATRQVNGMGTGVVIDPRGYILTNHHVVDGVRQIRVTLDDGSVDIARLIAHDRRTDLAVIKVSVGRKLPIIHIGTSKDLMTGEPVIAMGNAYGYEHTVTRGIISALHRDVQVSDSQAYDDLIQTDASINPGNSGGPLLNIEGDMIGVNVAVRAGAQGIGFAIPVNSAMRVAARLMSVERLERKWHGIQAATTNDDELVIQSVINGSPAARSGLKAGDVVERLGDIRVDRALDVERALLGRRLGEQLDMTVRRGEEKLAMHLAVARSGSTPARSTKKPSVFESRAWQMLGMSLETEPSKTFQRRDTRYRGGMRVVDVRPNGPAAEKGIRSGDILVGMHRWETASEEDIDYIVNYKAKTLASMDSVKFYVLRGDETLYGEMNVASVATSKKRR